MTRIRLHLARLLRSPDMRAFLGFCALAAVFYAPLLLGLRSFPPGDFTDHFLPFSLFQRAELLAGRLPLWNPYTFAGHPFLADVQAAVFYPLSNLLLLLTLPWSTPAARLYWLQVEAIIHIALAGGFTYLLARDLLRNRPAALLAGCVFALSGYLTGYPPLQLAVLRTAIWLPLLFWLLRRALAAPERWRWWLAATLVYVISFLAGHPQTFLFVSYAVAGWIAFLTLRTQRPRRRLLWRIAAFYVLFSGLAAAQLWPSLEFTALSVRAGVGYAYVSGGFPLRDTAQMLLPGFLSTYSPLYVGLVPLGLALLGGAWAVRSVMPAVLRAAPTRFNGFSASQPAVETAATAATQPAWAIALFFALLALLSLLVSYGHNGFLYPIFYRLAPGWAFFRGQERAALLVAFGLSLLSGYGAVALAGLAPRVRRRALLVYAALAAAGLLGVGYTIRMANDLVVSDVRLASGIAIGLLVLAAGIGMTWRRHTSPTHPPWGWLALVVVDLFIAGFTLNLAPRGDLPPATALAVAAANQTPDDRVPGRTHNEDVLFENYGMFVGVEELSGNSPLRLARYAALLDGFPRDRLWRLTGTQHVLSTRAQFFTPAEPVADLATTDTTAHLYRLTAPNPRAWVVNTVRVTADQAALPLLGDASFDPETTALLTPPAVLGLEDGVLALPGANSVRLERLAPNRLLARSNSEHGGLLVVSENWLPGWRATATIGSETQAVPVYRANLTFLGVPVEPGESTIDLVYRPDSIRFGLGISGVSLVTWLGACGVRAWAGRRKRAATPSYMLSRIAQRAALPAILLLAATLRAFRLGFQELRGDEALGRLFSLESFDQIIRSTLALHEPHPVASYFVEHIWLRIAGNSEFALRFATLWFGVLAVALVYRLGRRLSLGRRIPALAAALLAISPYAIWHSQDARMYSMSLALTTASTLLMLEGLARRSAQRWAVYIVITLLALHTHYYAAYIVIAQNLFVIGRALWARSERRQLFAWLLVQAATGLLYLPWLLVARATLTGYTGNGDSPDFFAMGLRSLSVFAVGESVPAIQQGLYALLAALLVSIGVGRLVLASGKGRRALFLLSLIFLAPLLLTWLGALDRPIFNERYLVTALPGFLLLIAAGALPSLMTPDARSTAGRRAAHAAHSALVAALVVACAYALAHHYADPIFSKTRGWRHSASLLERYSAGWHAQQTRVAQTYPDPTLWYYYQERADHLVLPPAAHDEAGASRVVAALAEEGVARVVILAQPSEAWDPHDSASRSLARHYALTAEIPLGDVRIRVYDRPPAILPSTDIAFANGVRLTAAAIPTQRLVAGDIVPVYLRWQGQADVLRGQEKITLQLLDASGKLVAQTDHPFGTAELAAPVTSYTIATPRELASGAYRLIAAIYDPGRPGAPRWLAATGADLLDLAQLSTQ